MTRLACHCTVSWQNLVVTSIQAGHCTVSWQNVVVNSIYKDRPFTVFQLAVHTCGYGRQCGRIQSRYIGVDINIYTVYITESEAAEFCSCHPLSASFPELPLTSSFRITRKLVFVKALIRWGSLTLGGELVEGYKFRHYVEGTRVGVLAYLRLFVWPAIVFFRFLFSACSNFARLHCF